MKWIGQNIYDYISRFRNDIYLDSPTAGGSDPDKFLGIDSDGKIIYRTGAEVASDIGAITSETGDISAVTAGTGLGGGGTTGAVNLSLDLTSGLSAVTPANGDSLATLDSDASTHQLTTISNLATLFAGTGLTASNSVIGVDAAQTQITSVGTITTGVWQGTAINQTYLVGQSNTNTGDETRDSIESLAITSVGTIANGVWNGTAIASAYLDSDTAHLSGTQTFSGAKTFTADTTTFTSATADSPTIKVLNTRDDDNSGQLIFEKLRDDDGVAQRQDLGEIWFRGQDNAQNTQDYAYIDGQIDVSTGGQESGKLILGVASHDGDLQTGLTLVGGDVDSEVDVALGSGAASVTTVNGTLTMGTTATINNSGVIQVAAQTVIDHDQLANFAANEHFTQANITTVGTIGTGVWQGTAINQTYLNGQSGTNTGDETRSSIEELGITVVGTIAEGTWNGTAIAHAYIGADAIEGDNIADNAVDSEHYTDGSIDTAHIADDQVTFAKALGVTPNVFGNVIKLLPSDFMANDDGGNTKFGVGYVDHAGSTFGMRAGNSATELFAFVSIPQGMTATHVDIFDKNDVAFEVFEIQVNATTMVSKGSGNCNTTVDITDVASTATNFLGIRVTTTTVNDKVYGGTVTIA